MVAPRETRGGPCQVHLSHLCRYQCLQWRGTVIGMKRVGNKVTAQVEDREIKGDLSPSWDIKPTLIRMWQFRQPVLPSKDSDGDGPHNPLREERPMICECHKAPLAHCEWAQCCPDCRTCWACCTCAWMPSGSVEDLDEETIQLLVAEARTERARPQTVSGATNPKDPPPWSSRKF
jgi:hypothetical protein